MVKWEYEVLNLQLPLPGGLLPHLKKFGDRGWEIVGVVKGNHGVTFLFKRADGEVQEEEPEPEDEQEDKTDGGLS